MNFPLQEHINYPDNAPLSVYVPDQSLQGPVVDYAKEPEEGESGEQDTVAAGSEDDQQIADSAPRQIVFREGRNFLSPQQVQKDLYWHGYNGQHVPKAQSRAFDVLDGGDVTQSFRGGRNFRYRDEGVGVQVIPALGYSLDDPQERKAYFDAVSRGLLGGSFGGEGRLRNNHKNYNNLRNYGPNRSLYEGPRPVQIQRPRNPLFKQLGSRGLFYNNVNSNSLVLGRHAQSTAKSIKDDVEYDVETRPSIFKGSSSYTVPLNSVGRLESDSDSVSGRKNGFALFRNR